jgi:hypothetical protein
MMGKPVNLDRGLPLAKTKPSQRKKTSKEAKEYYLSRQGKGGGDHYDNKHSKDTKEDLDRELDNHIASRSASAQQAQQESDPNEEGPEEEEEEGSAASPSSSA